jgi:hypothetical protein
MPISLWMSRCQAEPRIRLTMISTPPTPARINHAVRPAWRGSWCRAITTRRTSQRTSTPNPYPVAVRMPLIAPWSSQVRGSRDGVCDRQKKATANAMPTKS